MSDGDTAQTNKPVLADFLTQHEAAAELKVCERTLDRWRRLGEGPPITRLGRRVLYRRSSLLVWLRGREHNGPVTTAPANVPALSNTGA